MVREGNGKVRALGYEYEREYGSGEKLEGSN